MHDPRPQITGRIDRETGRSAQPQLDRHTTRPTLDARAEGYIDDSHFLMPTGSPDLQVMYITITDGAIAPTAVAAVLRNP